MTVTEAYARARDAFERPTLALLHQRDASVVLAVLRSSFARENEWVNADDFHVMVADQYERLRSEGADVRVVDDARTLVRSWVSRAWLIRDLDDGVERYGLTSHAQEALDFVRRLAGQRAMLSESRIRNVVRLARQAALDANPDRQAVLAALDAEIAALQLRRDDLATGGDLPAVPAERVLEQIADIQEVLATLPADFLRVSEAGQQVQRQMVRQFRAEGARAAEVIDQYLDACQHVLEATPEGRAFAGAIGLLRDETLMADFARDLDVVLSHEAAETLMPQERRELRHVATMISRNTRVVLEQQRRMTASLRQHIASRDHLRERELDEALSRAEAAVTQWMASSRSRGRLPERMACLSGVDVGNLRQRFADPRDFAKPTPLARNQQGQEPGGLATLRALGGPRYRELVEQLRQVSGGDPSRDSWTLAEVFDTSQTDLRRPVELVGYLQLAARGESQVDASDFDVVTAHRPDQSTRMFQVPRVVFHRDEIEALADMQPVERNN